jgi:hypothetical protein
VTGRTRDSVLADRQLQALQGRSDLQSAVVLVDVRGRQQEKGGNTSFAKLGVKPADHYPERCWLVSKPRGYFGDRAILGNDGPQCFVTPLEGELRAEKEATTELTIHGAGSHQLTVF